MLPDASGCTDWANPILAWALAAVGVTAKSTTSGSAESQNRPNVLAIAVIALLPRFVCEGRVGRALGEESDGRHLTCKKRISVIRIKYVSNFVITVTSNDRRYWSKMISWSIEAFATQSE
jgi:hypothetical protein